jgi:hypothetical protein
MVQYDKIEWGLGLEFAESRTWILEVKLPPKIGGDRKLRPTSATSNLSRF